MSRYAHTMSDGTIHSAQRVSIYRDRGGRGRAPLPAALYSHRNCTAGYTADNKQKMVKILMILSSAARTHTGNNEAGWYLPEAAHVCVFGPIPFILEPDT